MYAAKFDGRNGTAIASSLKDDIQLIGPGAIDPTHEEREPVLLKRPALVPITAAGSDPPPRLALLAFVGDTSIMRVIYNGTSRLF